MARRTKRERHDPPDAFRQDVGPVLDSLHRLDRSLETVPRRCRRRALVFLNSLRRPARVLLVGLAATHGHDLAALSGTVDTTKRDHRHPTP